MYSIENSIENRLNHSEAESELSKKKITANYLYRLADHTFLTEKERGKKNRRFIRAAPYVHNNTFGSVFNPCVIFV